MTGSSVTSLTSKGRQKRDLISSNSPTVAAVLLGGGNSIDSIAPRPLTAGAREASRAVASQRQASIDGAAGTVSLSTKELLERDYRGNMYSEVS